MKSGYRSRGRHLALVAAFGCSLIPIAASAQTGMGKAEAAQLYTAAGFPIVNNQPVNRCGKPAKPRVTFVDMNADKRPEALFTDGDPACYGFSGRYFALLVKEGATWRQVVHGTGSAQSLQSRTAGWLDLRISDSGCVREHRYDGRAYKAATDCLQAAVPSPKATQPAQPSVAPSQAAQPPASSPAQIGQSSQSSAPDKPGGGNLSPADEAAAYKAAGMKKVGKAWRGDCTDPNAPTDSASIEGAGDLNGDGLPEALITHGGSFCYGNTGQAFWLISKSGNGAWKLMTNAVGIPEFLKSKGAGGWPDISIGGPGFCFPVRRWDGKRYVDHRWEYDGKACKR